MLRCCSFWEISKTLSWKYISSHDHWDKNYFYDIVFKPRFYLKTLDTFGNCQRLVFTVCVSQHMPKITNMWKFELNRSSKLRDNNERKKTPFSHKVVCFQILISRPQILNPRSRNQIRGKLLLSWKLHYFRGSCFLRCCILSIPITSN